MAWNEPGKNGQNDPWNRKRPSGKSPLDDLLNNAKSHLGKLGQGPGSILMAVLILVVVFLLLSSYTIVGAREAGVVLRFGQYSRTLAPGFHLKLPQPIESVTKVEATRIRSVNDKVAMLTRDENIITIDFTVQYQVDDSRKYLFSLNDPDGTISAAAEAAVRGVIGGSDMDQVLSAAGANLVTEAQQALQKTLDNYNSGLRVTEVSFQNVTLSTTSTTPAKTSRASRTPHWPMPARSFRWHAARQPGSPPRQPVTRRSGSPAPRATRRASTCC